MTDRYLQYTYMTASLSFNKSICQTRLVSLPRLLRDSGGQVGPVAAGIATEICVAASSNDVALLESWNLAGISLDIPNATGRTPLHEAVCALCKDSVDYLLSRDVDLSMRDNIGHTAHDCAMAIQHRILENSSNFNEEKQKISAIIAAFEKRVR